MRNSLCILGDLDDPDLVWLCSVGTRRELASGETLVQAGRAIDELYFVTDGRFLVHTPEGRHVATLGLGDIIGEMSFVEQRPPSVSVSADGPARLLAVPRQAMLTRLADDAPFAARFYRALAVFLSDRLRTATAGGMRDAADAGGDIDDGILDTLHVAGDRFLRLLRLLDGQPD